MSKIKDKMIQSIRATKVTQDNDNQFITITQKQLFDLLRSNGVNVVVSSSIIPESSFVDVGSADNKINAVHTSKVYTNTICIGTGQNPYYIMYDDTDGLVKAGVAGDMQVLATQKYVDQKILELKNYVDEQIGLLK